MSVILCDLSRVLKILSDSPMLRDPTAQSMTPARELVEIPSRHRNVFSSSSGGDTDERAADESLPEALRGHVDARQILIPSDEIRGGEGF